MTSVGNYATPWQIGSPFYDNTGALQYSDSTHNCGFGEDLDGDNPAYQTRNSFWRAWMYLYTVNLWSAIAAPQFYPTGSGTQLLQGLTDVYL